MFYTIEHIPDEQTMQAVVAELLPLVPFVRREKALRYKHLHGQYTCLRTWQLLHTMLVEHKFLPADFPLSALAYTEDSYGKPHLAVGAAVNFSLSHTKNAIAVAIACEPVGMDIETIVPDKRIEQTFLDHTMSASEQAAIRAAADPNMAFTELWTRKEALFKAMGTGIDMSTLPTLLSSADSRLYTLFTGHADGYAFSIARCCR